ncbi:MAG: arginyl-tRNA synthetase [Rhodoglobus sp.]
MVTGVLFETKVTVQDTAGSLHGNAGAVRENRTMALRLRVLPAVIALSASALLLTACVPAEPELTGPNPTRTAGSSATPPATPDAEPSSPATSDPEATAVDVACTDLISPQAMYDFNPNFLLLNSFTPAANSPAAAALASKGVACRWENSTSGITIDVSVAKPSPSKLDTFKSQAGSPANGFDGYFSVANGTGTAQVFSGSYWATLSSQAFFEAADAADLVSDVRAALN